MEGRDIGDFLITNFNRRFMKLSSFKYRVYRKTTNKKNCNLAFF